jgi:hypothetical protein
MTLLQQPLFYVGPHYMTVAKTRSILNWWSGAVK